ncbi:MAG: hypothetical protein DRN04_02320 [Thermoprotei archaeon]|nr:MAG: hypothetical protein DRN04_02320 [Thermoprotei archaeon]
MILEIAIAKKYYEPEYSFSIYGESPPPWKIPLDYYSSVLIAESLREVFSIPFRYYVELQEALEELVEEGWRYLDLSALAERTSLEVAQVLWTIKRLFIEEPFSTSIFTGSAYPISYLSYIFGLIYFREKTDTVTICDAYLATPPKKLLTYILLSSLQGFRKVVLVYPSLSLVPPVLASIADKIYNLVESEEEIEFIEPSLKIEKPISLVDKLFYSEEDRKIAKTIIALLSEGSLVDRALIDAIVLESRAEEIVVRKIITKLITYGLISEKILPNGRSVLSLTRRGFLVAERVMLNEDKVEKKQ